MTRPTATIDPPAPAIVAVDRPTGKHLHVMDLLPYVGFGIFAYNLVQVLSGPRTGNWKQDIVLYAVVDLIGIPMFGAGISHICFRKATARSIGWESGGPFQFELGAADLAMGATALLAASYTPEYWLAIIIASGVFRMSCAVGHIRSWITDGNRAVNNTLILVTDVAVPVLLLWAWFAWT